ncbi:hypothetical protein ACFPRL_29555 [Pseudoclavibacter helvolus]
MLLRNCRGSRSRRPLELWGTGCGRHVSSCLGLSYGHSLSPTRGKASGESHVRCWLASSQRRLPLARERLQGLYRAPVRVPRLRRRRRPYRQGP